MDKTNTDVHKNARMALKKNNPKKRKHSHRSLMLINNTSIRKKVIAAWKRTKKNYDHKKAQLQRYETEDKPAFQAWLEKEFSDKLNTLQQLSREIKEQLEIVQQVRALSITLGSNTTYAYHILFGSLKSKIVLRNNLLQETARDWEPEEDNRDDEEDVFNAEQMQNTDNDPNEMDEEIRELFEALWENTNGSQEDYEQMFQKFKEDFVGFTQEAADDETKQFPWDFPAEPDFEERDQSCKNLYRKLARKLHPDFCADFTEETKNLWQRVQNAYAEGDMEELLAVYQYSQTITDSQLNGMAVSDLNDLIDDYKIQTQILNSEINRCKIDPAWEFTVSQDHTQLEKQTNQQIQKTLDQKIRKHSSLEKLINSWKILHHFSGKKVFIPPAEQMEFSFD